MPVDPASLDHDTLRSALDAAREELLASFFAKQKADQGYLEAVAAYELIADALRRAVTVGANQVRTQAP